MVTSKVYIFIPICMTLIFIQSHGGMRNKKTSAPNKSHCFHLILMKCGMLPGLVDLMIFILIQSHLITI